MAAADLILYGLAKLFYRSEVAHSSEMKTALTDSQSCYRYRAREFERIVSAARRHQVDIQDSEVLDFGCNNGAITSNYISEGASRVVGVDIDRDAIKLATHQNRLEEVSFLCCDVDSIPLEDGSVDVVVSYDVFEHVSRPASILSELHRVLRPGGRVLIGTWSWYHPFAPHLWSVMPVPWAHMFVSERTLLRACRRVYNAKWYAPTMHDFDEHGNRKPDKYKEDAISTDYLNKLLIKDFERLFNAANFEYETHLQPFGSVLATWTRVFLRVPVLRECFAGYAWFVLRKPTSSTHKKVLRESQRSE